MKIKITYKEALENCPEKVKELLEYRKKSKSKHKNVIPEELNWELLCAELIERTSFKDLMQQGKKNKIQKLKIERLSVCLEASKERARWSSERYELVSEKLFSFIEEKEKKLQKEIEENDKLDGKITEELIRELQKYGGFSMFGFDPQTGGYKKVDKI